MFRRPISGSVDVLVLHTTIIIVLFLNHVQSKESNITHGARKRELDGAYSPRDKDHGEGEYHNSKFDHEAILGKFH